MRRVNVRLAPSVAAVVDNRDMPDINLQHMVAVMLMDKTASFHAAHDKPRMQDPTLLRQRAKVSIVRDEALAFSGWRLRRSGARPGHAYAAVRHLTKRLRECE